MSEVVATAAARRGTDSSTPFLPSATAALSAAVSAVRVGTRRDSGEWERGVRKNGFAVCGGCFLVEGHALVQRNDSRFYTIARSSPYTNNPNGRVESTHV